MNNEIKDSRKEFMCNINGNIYNIQFSKTSNFEIDVYNSFIEVIRSSGVELFLESFTEVCVNDLVNYFNTMDVEKLNLLYCKCMLIDTTDSNNIIDLLLSYFESFIDCRKELFCSKNEADTFIKMSSLPMFLLQESIVVDKIKSAIKLEIVKDINDNHRLERKFRLKRKKRPFSID